MTSMATSWYIELGRGATRQRSEALMEELLPFLRPNLNGDDYEMENDEGQFSFRFADRSKFLAAIALIPDELINEIQLAALDD